MVGAIGKLEILCHPLVTIQCFGWFIFVRAVFAGHDETFLSLLSGAGAFQPAPEPVAEFISRSRGLEQRVMRIYLLLAQEQTPHSPCAEFFEELARQEDRHAELLGLCEAAVERRHRRRPRAAVWQGALPEVAAILEEAEEAVRNRLSLVEALRLVLRIESSQINTLFIELVETTEPRFIRAFVAFRTAVREHLAYVRRQIPLLVPALEAEAQLLSLEAALSTTPADD